MIFHSGINCLCPNSYVYILSNGCPVNLYAKLNKKNKPNFYGRIVLVVVLINVWKTEQYLTTLQLNKKFTITVN